MQLVIELAPREQQLAFNRRRWEAVCADPELARIPGKIETNAHGQILLSPPPSGSHSYLQSRIPTTLSRLLGGVPLSECPVSTIDGVPAADVGWYSEARFAQVKGQIAFQFAPEICVEVLSPSHTPAEMTAEKQLYFEAGAVEVWLCAEDGTLTFFHQDHPTAPERRSSRCPDFPASI